MLSLLLSAAMAAGAAAPAWHDGLDWHGVHVSISRDDTTATRWRGRSDSV